MSLTAVTDDGDGTASQAAAIRVPVVIDLRPAVEPVVAALIVTPTEKGWWEKSSGRDGRGYPGKLGRRRVDPATSVPG